MSRWSEYLNSSVETLNSLKACLDPVRVEAAITVIARALGANKPLLVCGNGGSAADSMHISAELVGRFLKERRALKVIALAADAAFITAWSNDVGYDRIFSRQVQAYAEVGGVLLAISTSGKSENVVAAVIEAKSKGMNTIALTGRDGGQLAALVDILLKVPSDSTPHIQQAHICLYHFMCAEVEERISSSECGRG